MAGKQYEHVGCKRKTARHSVYRGRQSIWALSHNPAVERGLGNAYFAEPGLGQGYVMLYDVLKNNAVERNIRVRCQMPAIELIQDVKTKEVPGVVAERQGRQRWGSIFAGDTRNTKCLLCISAGLRIPALNLIYYY